jgi:hypothetical protein
MKRAIRMSAALLPIAALALSEDLQGAAGDLLGWVHSGFLIVFVDAATFVRSCF